MAKKITKSAAQQPIVAKRDFPFKRNSLYFINMPDKNDPNIVRTLELPSVTTILTSTSDKQNLINWKAKLTAKIALENPSATVEEILSKADTVKDSAIDLGKTIHKFAEDYVNGTQLSAEGLPERLQPYAEAFLSFIELHKPRILFTEVCVFNATYGYAGTADLIAIMSNGKTAILDWKTGKNTYKDNHLQQMAYANAEYIYTNDHKVIPMPKIDEQYLVHLKDNGTAHLIPVKEDFNHFLKSLTFYPTAKYRAQLW